jgi:hypothetical protein
MESNVLWHERKWNEMFERLKEFKLIHGNCLVPSNYTEDRRLGTWVQRQRSSFKRELLSSVRQKKLESVGFVWQVLNREYFILEANERRWYYQFQKVAAFKEKHGHTMIPQNIPGGPPLGNWINTQRVAFRRGELRPDRVEVLDHIGFTWSFEEEWEQSWTGKYNDLQVYVELHGSIRNLSKHRSLWVWMHSQRVMNAKGTLDPQRKAMLDRLNVDWKFEGIAGNE